MIGFGKIQGGSLQHVTRKELLRLTAVALMSVIGVAAVLQGTIGSFPAGSRNLQQPTTSVYGN